MLPPRGARALPGHPFCALYADGPYRPALHRPALTTTHGWTGAPQRAERADLPASPHRLRRRHERAVGTGVSHRRVSTHLDQ